MEKSPIFGFKAKCLALLERLRTNKGVYMAPHQTPVAERSAWIESMRDSIEIVGDIMSPADDESEWEALRD